MAGSRGKWIALAVAAPFAALAVAAGVWTIAAQRGQAPKPPRTLPVRLDRAGPYLIMATEAAAAEYSDAIEEAKALHPDAAEAVFSARDLATARNALLRHQPRYALVLMRPEEMDANFAWRWLTLTATLDDDPFVDVRTGFITGETPQAAADFLRRIRAAAGGQLKLSGAVIDNLGPNQMMAPAAFQETQGAFLLPVFASHMPTTTISHGTLAFKRERPGALAGPGIIHFGGHGFPERIVDGIRGSQMRGMTLSPCVVFNGACYTGVTDRWFDTRTGRIVEQRVGAAESFCLGMLSNNVVAYLAALHPDHGIPVYQEMEYMAFTGAPLGEVIKHTHDGVILASGAKPPQLPAFSAGKPAPGWQPSDIMLNGTAARVLFGDPALIVTDAFSPAPFTVTVEKRDDATLGVRAVVATTALKSAFTDTYHSDLSVDRRQFNDCARIACDLPAGWDGVGEVKVVSIGPGLKHRLVGFGIERDGDARRLHVQIDVGTTGYMKSPLRRAGATVELEVKR